MTCNFTLKHYEEICKIINNSKYQLCFFDECLNKNDNVLILRHDIDLSLEQSLKIAIIEKQYHIKSTFFVWLSSPFYNIFEKKYVKIMHKILTLGHKIGLHFDESLYKIKDEIDLNFFIEKEIRVLNSYFDLDIDVVSMHRPSKWILNNDIQLKKYINVYSKMYFEEFKYISDSRRQWRKECVCKQIEKGNYPKLHLLLHPIWWVKNDMSFIDRMNSFKRTKINKLEKDLQENISVYHRKENKCIKNTKNI
jgi:hypothetical protein